MFSVFLLNYRNMYCWKFGRTWKSCGNAFLVLYNWTETWYMFSISLLLVFYAFKPFLMDTYTGREKALVNEETFVADTNFVSGTLKMFLILIRNILCLQQMFPSLHSPRNVKGNNVSATMCPRLPGPIWLRAHCPLRAHCRSTADIL